MTCGPVVVLAFCVAAFAPAARATPPGALISSQVDSPTYQHYLEDLLYTHLGDNRGNGPQHDLARTNIVSTLQSFGLTVALEPFVYLSVTYYNVVATQPGTDTPGQVIVVGAHFDSVNNPGADDNATGTALVMETARILSQHRATRTIRYCLFDREEQGRRGSIAYVAAHPGETVLAVTADMIGHDSGAFGTDLYGRTTSSVVVNGLASAITTYGNHLSPFVNLGNYSFSDHWSFESAGIPSVVAIERCYTCNANYHTPNDAVDIAPGYISYPLATEVVKSFVGYLVDTVPVALWGDSDNDADVDAADLAAFRSCYGAGMTPVCRAFDRDMDGDVDCSDWPSFRLAYFSSSGMTPALSDDEFVEVLLGNDTNAADVCIADMNLDGTVDGRDVAAQVAADLGN
ncbi:MAG TPA: M28 family peptidase [Phycisphaerae bacterium]|nr:M28 family peptidase [Phycisphaerae bacterium]